MKKVIFAALAVAGLILASCSADDETAKAGNPNVQLEGGTTGPPTGGPGGGNGTIPPPPPPPGG